MATHSPCVSKMTTSPGPGNSIGTSVAGSSNLILISPTLSSGTVLFICPSTISASVRAASWALEVALLALARAKPRMGTGGASVRIVGPVPVGIVVPPYSLICSLPNAHGPPPGLAGNPSAHTDGALHLLNRSHRGPQDDQDRVRFGRPDTPTRS